MKPLLQPCFEAGGWIWHSEVSLRKTVEVAALCDGEEHKILCGSGGQWSALYQAEDSYPTYSFIVGS